MSARERTAYWVQNHSPIEDEFYSPSLPPSVIDGLVPSSPPSEADSSHSTPPKMVLRYNDGRPDVPIPHPGSMGKPGSRMYQNSPQTSSSHSRARSGSSSDSPGFKPSYIHRRDHESRSPEEIRILPSSGEVPTSSTSSRHTRSKSLPRSSDHHRPPAPDVPFMPPAHMQTQSPYYGQGPTTMGPQGTSPPQQVSFAPPTHPWPPRHGHPKHTPPAIIYAPSHRSHQPHYSPPAMFHHPPRMGPNGMIYSHSAPVPGQYPPAYPTPYPSVAGVSSHRHTSSAHDIRGPGGRDPGHTRSLGRSTRIHPSSSSTSLTSQNSGSTYYVLPAHGQKVHVIVSRRVYKICCWYLMKNLLES